MSTTTNEAVTLLPSAARTVLQNLDQLNPFGRGLHLTIDVTAGSGGGITPTIQGKDPASGKYYTLLTGTKITGTGTTTLKVYPGLTVSANVVASDILPRNWRLALAVDDTTSYTYSVGVSYAM